MQTLETTDLKEARRSRIAQFSGRSANLVVGGTAITGLVKAVREDKSSATPRWLITIVADRPKAAPQSGRGRPAESLNRAQA